MTIYRYALQRKSDKKVYKNPSAIYLGIEEYWSSDISQARLWLYKPSYDDVNFAVLTFKLRLENNTSENDKEKSVNTP